MTQPRVPRPPEPVDPGGPGRRPLLLPGRRIILGDPSQVLGRSWGQLVAWLVLVAGAGVDVATFYQVLILVMNAPEEVVWGAVIGFTAIALALAHRVGTLAGDAANPRNMVGAKVTAWVCFAIWLTLGITGFLVRLLIQGADAGGGSMFMVDGQPVDVRSETTSQYLSALLFLVLYLATGMVSGLAGYIRPNPAARLWKRALRKRTRASRRYADSQSRLATARKLAETTVPIIDRPS